VALLGLASTATIAARTLFPLVALQQVLFPLWIIALAGTLLARLPRPTPETTGTAGAPEQPDAGHVSPAGRVPQRRHAS
jgi:hypothetical protein